MPQAPDPATLLADMLDSWEVPQNASAQSARGFGGNGATHLEAWRRVGHAAKLLRSVDNLLTGMTAAGQDVEMYSPYLPAWYGGVFFTTTPWDSSSQNARPRPVCQPHEIHLLRALGASIRAIGGPVIDESAARGLRDILDQALALLEADATDFEAEVRFYLHGLISRARMVVDNVAEYGSYAVREVSLELGGAMIVRGAQVKADDPEKGSRWTTAGVMLVAGVLGRAGERGLDSALEVGGQIARAALGG